MVEDTNRLITTLEKTLHLVNEECKRRERDNERRHEEMQKLLDISTKGIESVRIGIKDEMGQTRMMIAERYEYFGAMLTYLTALMTGLFLFFIISSLDISSNLKSALTLLLTVIAGILVFSIWYRTHRHITKS